MPAKRQQTDANHVAHGSAPANHVCPAAAPAQTGLASMHLPAHLPSMPMRLLLASHACFACLGCLQAANRPQRGYMLQDTAGMMHLADLMLRPSCLCNNPMPPPLPQSACHRQHGYGSALALISNCFLLLVMHLSCMCLRCLMWPRGGPAAVCRPFCLLGLRWIQLPEAWPRV